MSRSGFLKSLKLKLASTPFHGLECSFPVTRYFVDDSMHCFEVQEKSDRSGIFVNYGFTLTFLPTHSGIPAQDACPGDCEGFRRIEGSRFGHNGFPYSEASVDEVVSCAVSALESAVKYIGKPEVYFLNAKPVIIESGEWTSFVQMTKSRSALLFSEAAAHYKATETAVAFCDYGLSLTSLPQGIANKLQGLRARLVA